MSMSLWTDLRSIERLNDRIQKLGKFNEHDLLDMLGAEVETQTRRRLSTEKTAPDGSEWAELSDDYKAWKQERSSGGLLELNSDLIQSIQYLVVGDAVIAGSNLVYARRHNLGDDVIEQREYLGLSSDNIDDISDQLDEFLDDHITRVLQ